jgi:hypothetical protein
MAGINIGILPKAAPLSVEQIKRLEKQVLEEQKTFAYLNENYELCFVIPCGIDYIKDLAWHNAYELRTEEEKLVKKVYKKTGLKTFYLEKVLQKTDIEDSWIEDNTIVVNSLLLISSDAHILKDCNEEYLTVLTSE